ncbi:hypothetical protein CF95_gp198 [Erwinia phage PhiEaH1]|uniref:Uncharacterized protein n=1 Tax=Erwinia phage PhiEaH1 TaxID=1401669 RepID=W8D003_9CAUD|nr:hypothetical protein CF95_gp198 [Erwinia phage PhiEaH1]AGX01920.1 hypothetical protein [Erwinia phage PhiEaH1]
MIEALLMGRRKPSAAWALGTEMLAWDSSIFRDTGFVDYTGKTLKVTSVIPTAGAAVPPLLPSLGAESFQYGKGVEMGHGSVATPPGTIAPGFVTSAWTVDYWKRDLDVLSPVNKHQPLIPLIVYPDLTVNGYWTNRLQCTLGYANTARLVGIWNNQAAPRINGTKQNDAFYGTDWKHIAVMYSGGKVYFFCNGVLIDTLTYTILTPTGNQQVGIMSQSVANSPDVRGMVERYRLRAGALFPTTGFTADTATLYPSA